MNKINDVQEHRGADEGYRSKPENIARQCEQITGSRYRWTGDRGPIGFSPSRKHWSMPSSTRKKFLTVNYRFKDDGTKVRVI